LRIILLVAAMMLATPAIAAPPYVSGSYYHPKFNGRAMACGGRYSDGDLTAASNHYPCGTLVEVTHGGRSVIVEITDRCGRCGIDLSRAAAREIGLIGPGRARVQVRPLF
jgi:rare lipoprotein A